jgi:hypothetical protein
LPPANLIWHHSQVVRQRSAKPLFSSSNLDGASKKPPDLGGFYFFIKLVSEYKQDKSKANIWTNIYCNEGFFTMTNAMYHDLFESYNNWLSSIFEEIIQAESNENNCEDHALFLSMKQRTTASVDDWLQSKLYVNGNMTSPAEIIDLAQNQQDIVDLAYCAALVCDDEIPDFVTKKVLSADRSVFSEIEKLVLESDWSSENNPECDDDIIAVSRLIPLLNHYESEGLHKRVLDKFTSTDIPHELIISAIKDYCVNAGSSILPQLINRLENANENKLEIVGSLEYLVVLLSEVGKNHRSPTVFNSLKTCFRKMPNKVIGAICLADYGDPRGIVALKSWLDNHVNEIDRPLFMEILASIKRLGGEISDIRSPF